VSWIFVRFCACCTEVLIRYLLNLTAYISACVYVCLFWGGVKKNVTRELKTSIQVFLPILMTNNDDKEIEDERINNTDVREDGLRTLDLRYVANF
jgi:hypothetical protein